MDTGGKRCIYGPLPSLNKFGIPRTAGQDPYPALPGCRGEALPDKLTCGSPACVGRLKADRQNVLDKARPLTEVYIYRQETWDKIMKALSVMSCGLSFQECLCLVKPSDGRCRMLLKSGNQVTVRRPQVEW